ncbi:hypothetical protein N7509_010739 [Penicillium cosmopolitanum]|uniref:Uncharacterized protein n=1 Tax=Penicillium cosmopolitanum TaxID=1131564 RepID=A0A9W9VRY3_9EURO|nr:uncharacterized protein N7509_010739 [Penicillium cosmopolitanum]KAJ5388198.1 hypothetical protein N7509_010739 [Penicillium cosmopolitanum]
MTVLEIPQDGLTLRAESQAGEPAATRAQFMRLALAQNTLDELISSMQKGQSARVRLGKHPSLQYAGKTESFHAYPETHRSEVYETSDKRTLYFAGVLSHSLEVAKAKEDTEDVSKALETLQAGLSAHEREKEAKQSYLVSHPDELKALAKVNKGNRMSIRSGGPKDKSRRLGASGMGSLHPSPKLGAAGSPALAPTSAPSQSKSDIRLEALKTPFVHLLAVRAVSTQYLSRLTCAPPDDITTLAKKFGVENRLNREKFDLRDKIYKDLDMWKFPYPNDDDRENAIQNAISAFDRMRISRTDKLWQMLLPKEERGKGKCLSRLNLHTISASNVPTKKATTPRIQVDGAEDRADETDRAKASDAPRPTQKSKEKDGSKKQLKGKSANNSTLTGRVTKKTASKPAPAKPEGKFKSAEFVNSSDDEDDDMLDAPSPQPAPAPAPRPKESKKAPATAPIKKTQSAAKPQPVKPVASTPKVSKAQTSTPKLESSQPTPSSKRPAPRPSTSPQKPSPLGSSPPASASENAHGRNRSDSQNQSSGSSSSSPLISQLARNSKATGTAARPPSKPAASANGPHKPLPTKASAQPPPSKSAPPKPAPKPVPARPTSTKPTPLDSTRNKPTRPGPVIGRTASKTLPAGNPRKRKADPDLGSESERDGHLITTGNLEHKRRRAVSTSSGSTGSASPSMTQEVLRKRLLDKSEKFKEYYAKYSALHETLAKQAQPIQRDVDKLEKQHKRLQQMKQEIWDENRRLRDEGIIS